MGAVYRAIRDEGDFPLQVAIKVVKRGMDTNAILRRFRDERRILARLDHPGIAKLLDGGATPDGRPYFVMEFLEGTPVHTYCRVNDLSVRERLELFLHVCDAVEYSHRNLVVHRDLKASNILVTAAGVPKLLDFGIAKLIDRDTSTAGEATTRPEKLLTPDYASPEQIRGEPITTATDVYSLGVLLFELLADRRPFQLLGLPQAEMARVLATADPPRPSAAAEGSVRRQIAVDLDTIVLKAMHQSADRRYASVQQFADDIRRYLDGRTVIARPDTAAYRVRKFLGRHKAVVTTAVLGVIALFVSGVGTAWQSGVAESRRQEAQKRFGDLRELANAFLGELDTELEKLPGSTPAREILVAKVLRYLDMLAKDDIQDRSLQRELAIAYARLADVQGNPTGSNLGNSAGALESYSKALAILQPLASSTPDDLQISRDLARSYSKVSDVLAVTGDHLGAFEYEQKALSVREDWLSRNPNDPQAKRAVAASLQEVATNLARLGQWSRVPEYRRRALRILEDLQASGYTDTNLRLALALAHKRLGRSLYREKNYAEAISSYDRAIEIERLEVERDPANVNARVNLAFTNDDRGLALFHMGNFDAAMKNFSTALAIREPLAKSDPQDVRSASTLASTQLHIGETKLKLGDYRGGTADIKTALTARERLAERDPKNAGAQGEVAEALSALGDAYAGAGNQADARIAYERARKIFLELRDRGILAVEFGKEPERLAALIR